MTIEIAAAYGITAAITMALGCMAAYNRRNGWQRDRHDIFTENLMTWAEVQGAWHAESRQAAPPKAAPEALPVQITAQLLLLQTALGMNTAMRCEPGTTERVQTARVREDRVTA